MILLRCVLGGVILGLLVSKICVSCVVLVFSSVLMCKVFNLICLLFWFWCSRNVIRNGEVSRFFF